ncbi:MAG: inorganic phosphate transporter [Elusimicrobiales bacterium]|nr:inorganic phosphate transporter [Elusimicrobiales bacterium]
MDSNLLAVVALIGLALVFDFLNGFHDAANSIATAVSTRLFSPRQAVVWAAFFNVLAFFLFNHEVAKTMGKGIVDIAVVDNFVIFGALGGACAWNIITWYFGLPSSSSHALMGGLAGAALVKAGPASLVMKGIMMTVAFIVISPLLGMLLGIVFATLFYRISARTTPTQVNGRFKRLQLLSSAAYCIGHGGNDAQKTMGLITGLLFSAGYMKGEFMVPVWVAVICYSAMGLGTLFGGWRIVKTMGSKISKLKTIDGFSAEAAGAVSLYTASALGVPVSTTHTITGAIMGVGTIKRFSAVKWGVAGQIVWGWVLTIPGAALISAALYMVSAALLK